LEEELLRSKRAGAVPLVTIDPASDPKVGGAVTFQDINSGFYDQRLNNLIDILSSYNGPVYVRFAHEMDIGINSWGLQDPATFIESYRHFVQLARNQGATNLKWVWSPAGGLNAVDYYPGDDVVDVVGVTIVYTEAWYKDHFPSFHDLAHTRSWFDRFNKPLWITEFGIDNDDVAFQQRITQEALSHFRDFGFSALIYDNMSDPTVVRVNYTLPDLSIIVSAIKDEAKLNGWDAVEIDTYDILDPLVDPIVEPTPAAQQPPLKVDFQTTFSPLY
jgi:beta-mannanase